MNWFRTILDGLAMSAVFNCCVAVFWILKWDIFSPCKVGSFVGNGRNVPGRCACVREGNKIE